MEPLDESDPSGDPSGRRDSQPHFRRRFGVVLGAVLVTLGWAISIAQAEEAGSDSMLDDLLAEPQREEAQRPEKRRAKREGVGSATLDSESRPVEVIVVTANRREENIQDVVGGVQVFAGEELERAGTSGLGDFVFKIPGADLVDDGAAKKISIRGIANAGVFNVLGTGTTSPVGLYLNDTPIQGNGTLPDLDLYDVERIEVLKGPQGTLYGEGAQGGAVKILLNKADPSRLFAKGEVGLGRTDHASGLNHMQKLAVNVPLSGTWAARVVGTRRVEQGYIDFPRRGTDGENDVTNLMVRLHLDGEVMEGLDASFLVLHQRQRQDQFATAQLSEGSRRNRNQSAQFQDSDFTISGLTLDYDLGFATLTSSTGAFLNDREAIYEFRFASALPGLEGVDFGGEWVDVDNRQLGVTQELRIVSAGDSWLQWVGGVYYRWRKNNLDYLITNGLSNDPPPVGPGLIKQKGPDKVEQIALFGEATVDLPWDFQLGLGLRGFRETVDVSGVTALRGILYPAALFAGEPDGQFPELSFDTTTTSLTPKFSLSWLFDDWRMVYARIAKGVRSGGVNFDATYVETPALFDPDILWTYEVGAKTQWYDGLLTANMALFYNSWRDLQVKTLDAGAPLRGTGGAIPFGATPFLNAARAFSRGIELELAALLPEDVTLGFNLFLGDGEISKGDSTGALRSGTPLPQLAELSYSAYAIHEANQWPVMGFTPVFSFDTQYTGDRFSTLPVGDAVVFPALQGFQSYNLQVAFTSEHWEMSVGVRNLTDTRPQLGNNALDPDTITLGRPRTWLTRLGFRF